TVFYINSSGNYTWTATSSWDTDTQLAEQDITDFGFIKGLTLGNLYDVSTTSLSINDILYWTGTEWAVTATSTWDTNTGWTALTDMNLSNGYIYTGYLGSPIATSSIFVNAITKNVGIGTTSPSARLAVDGGIILTGNIMPYLASSSQNIGSSNKRFKEGWFDQLYANNMNIGSTSISGSNSAIFTINSGNTTNDLEDSIYEFERGSATPNAQIIWDSSEDAITFNLPIGIQDANELRLYEDSGSGLDYVGFKAPTTLSGNQIWILPLADGNSGEALLTDSSGTLYWGDSAGSGTIASSVPGWIPYYAAYGNVLSATSTIYFDTTQNYVGIGTTTPDSLFHVDGDGTFDRLCIGGICIDEWGSAGSLNSTAVTIGGVATWYDADTLTASTSINVAYGGTGKQSWTQYAIPYLSDSNTFSEITIGNSSYVLAVNGTQDGYTWIDASSTGATYQFSAEYSPAQSGIIQTYATSTAGNDFQIISNANIHTFYLPDASSSARGLLTGSDWSIFNNKWDDLSEMPLDDGYVYVGYGTSPIATSTIFIDTAQNYIGIGTTTPLDLFNVYGDIGILNQNGIKFYDNGSNYFAQLKASSTMSGDVTWYLPPADSSTAGDALMTDANGNFYFGTPTGAGTNVDSTEGYITFYKSSGSTVSGTSTIFIDNNQNVGIATNTPQYQLTVAGDMMLTGAIYDNNYSAGTDGYILRSTGSGVEWLATSSLGLPIGSGSAGALAVWTDSNTLSASSTLQVAYGGTGLLTAPSYGELLLGNASGGYTLTATSSLGLMDSGMVSALSDNYLTKWDGSAFANALIYDDGAYVGIGTTTPLDLFNVYGDIGILNQNGIKFYDNGSNYFAQLKASS
ncbi:MAG: hypothetical protein U9Q85_01400, partial [Patescibacteria group bacterium]|nr:hypothetical protein [Patescibacteria group bacterium]